MQLAKRLKQKRKRHGLHLLENVREIIQIGFSQSFISWLNSKAKGQKFVYLGSIAILGSSKAFEKFKKIDNCNYFNASGRRRQVLLKKIEHLVAEFWAQERLKWHPNVSQKVQDDDLMFCCLKTLVCCRVQTSNQNCIDHIVIKIYRTCQITPSACWIFFVNRFLENWNQIVQEVEVAHQIFVIIHSHFQKEQFKCLIILSEYFDGLNILIYQLRLLPHDIIKSKTSSMFIVIMYPFLQLLHQLRYGVEVVGYHVQCFQTFVHYQR